MSCFKTPCSTYALIAGIAALLSSSACSLKIRAQDLSKKSLTEQDAANSHNYFLIVEQQTAQAALVYQSDEATGALSVVHTQSFPPLGVLAVRQR
jgi:hypothetical protein